MLPANRQAALAVRHTESPTRTLWPARKHPTRWSCRATTPLKRRQFTSSSSRTQTLSPSKRSSFVSETYDLSCQAGSDANIADICPFVLLVCELPQLYCECCPSCGFFAEAPSFGLPSLQRHPTGSRLNPRRSHTGAINPGSVRSSANEILLNILLAFSPAPALKAGFSDPVVFDAEYVLTMYHGERARSLLRSLAVCAHFAFAFATALPQPIVSALPLQSASPVQFAVFFQAAVGSTFGDAQSDVTLAGTAPLLRNAGTVLSVRVCCAFVSLFAFACSRALSLSLLRGHFAGVPHVQFIDSGDHQNFIVQVC